MNSKVTMGNLGYSENFNKDELAEPPDEIDGIKRFWGKYRGIVLPMPDIDRRGRLMVEVTDVNGPNFCGWALPCLPWAGPGMGAFIVPAPGTNVWVEFERGHPDYAIWCGFWWGSPVDTPLVAKTSMPILPICSFGTSTSTLTLTDATILPYLPYGGILIGNPSAGIAIDASGVRIFGPSVQINGTPDGLARNAAALLVI